MGFAEIIAALDSLLKRSMSSNEWKPEAEQMLYRGSIGSIAFGSGLGFLFGSYLYQQFGIMGGCTFIGTMGILHLVLAVIFVLRMIQTQPSKGNGDVVHPALNRKHSGLSPTVGRKVSFRVLQISGSLANLSSLNMSFEGAVQSGSGHSVHSGHDDQVHDAMRRHTEFEHANVFKVFTPFLLSTGAIMITTTFTVTALYWEDVWDAEPFLCGFLLFNGEIAGFLTLHILNSKLLRNKKLIQQPALIMLATVSGMVAVSPMAFGQLTGSKGSLWAFYLDAAGTVLVNISNSMLHSSGIELMVLSLPIDLFQTALTRGYVIKRIVNCAFGLLFAVSYGISTHLPYQIVAGYFVLYLMSLLVVFQRYSF